MCFDISKLGIYSAFVDKNADHSQSTYAEWIMWCNVTNMLTLWASLGQRNMLMQIHKHVE
jgi:hypothetical protein